MGSLKLLVCLQPATRPGGDLQDKLLAEVRARAYKLKSTGQTGEHDHATRWWYTGVSDSIVHALSRTFD